MRSCIDLVCSLFLERLADVVLLAVPISSSLHNAFFSNTFKNAIQRKQQEQTNHRVKNIDRRTE